MRSWLALVILPFVACTSAAEYHVVPRLGQRQEQLAKDQDECQAIASDAGIRPEAAVQSVALGAAGIGTIRGVACLGRRVPWRTLPRTWSGANLYPLPPNPC